MKVHQGMEHVDFDFENKCVNQHMDLKCQWIVAVRNLNCCLPECMMHETVQKRIVVVNLIAKRYIEEKKMERRSCLERVGCKIWNLMKNRQYLILYLFLSD